MLTSLVFAGQGDDAALSVMQDDALLQQHQAVGGLVAGQVVDAVDVVVTGAVGQHLACTAGGGDILRGDHVQIAGGRYGGRLGKGGADGGSGGRASRGGGHGAHQQVAPLDGLAGSH